MPEILNFYKPPAHLQEYARHVSVFQRMGMVSFGLRVPGGAEPPLFEIWYYGVLEPERDGEEGPAVRIVNGEEPALVVARSTEDGREIVLHDNALYGLNNLLGLGEIYADMRTRQLQKLEIPPVSLEIELFLPEDPKEYAKELKRDESGNVVLPNGDALPYSAAFTYTYDDFTVSAFPYGDEEKAPLLIYDMAPPSASEMAEMWAELGYEAPPEVEEEVPQPPWAQEGTKPDPKEHEEQFDSDEDAFWEGWDAFLDEDELPFPEEDLFTDEELEELNAGGDDEEPIALTKVRDDPEDVWVPSRLRPYVTNIRGLLGISSFFDIEAELWYYGRLAPDPDAKPGDEDKLLIVDDAWPALLVAKDKRTGEEYVLHDQARHGILNLFQRVVQVPQNARPLKKLELRPGRVTMLLMYDVSMEENAWQFDFDLNGNVYLADGGTMPWHEALLEGYSLVTIQIHDDEGENTILYQSLTYEVPEGPEGEGDNEAG